MVKLGQTWRMTQLCKVAVAATILALTTFSAPQAMAADPRAQDAVDLFIDACVTDVLGLRPRVVDPSRISSHPTREFGFQVERRLRSAPVYEFNFKDSRAKVFTSHDRGLCAAWVGHADEADIQAAFERAVQRAAAEGRATLAPASAEGPAESGGTLRAWVLRSQKVNLVLSITTSLPAYGVQHVMTSASAPQPGPPLRP
jgi:hypothetical protein